MLASASGWPARRRLRSTRPAARWRTPRAPTSACCRCSGLNVDVVGGVEPGDLVRRVTRPANVDVLQAAAVRPARAARPHCGPPPTSVSDALGPADPEPARNARIVAADVVERVEIARRHQPRAQRIALAEREALQDRRCSGMIVASMPKPPNTSTRKLRRHDVADRPARWLFARSPSAAGGRGPRRCGSSGRPGGRAARAISIAGQRRQQERRCRGREDVNDVARRSCADRAAGSVSSVDDRPGAFDVEGPAQQRSAAAGSPERATPRRPGRPARRSADDPPDGLATEDPQRRCR